MARKRKKWNLNTRLVSAIRQEFRYSPMKREAILNARVGRWRDDKYKCSQCLKTFPRKEITVDHVACVVKPQTGFKDWNTYIKRMFVDAKYLQVLCKLCHKSKTLEERRLRSKKLRV